LAERPQALLVDWGGVLTTNLFASFAGWCHRAGVDFEELGRRFLQDKEFHRLLVDLECGRIDETVFEPRFAALLGVPSEGLIDGLMADVRPDWEMIEAVRTLRGAGIKTGLISNSWGVHRYPHDLFEELFDGVVISGEEGMRKPAPEMYRLGAERVGVEPRRCVYVDDLPHNLGPAAELGMATIHHTNTEQTIARLAELFGVDLRIRAA
jgi:putative hydrolase of the HAD superfamily